MPRGIGIAILLLEVPLFAGLGNVACIYLVDKYNLKTKTVVIITLLWIGLLIPICKSDNPPSTRTPST